MAYKKEIEQEINEVTSLLDLTEVYGEIAATRMKKIRDVVLKNRDFLGSIKSIFEDALKAYSEKLALLVKRGKLKEGGRVTFLAHNGKTVAVLISANTGFYGDIVRETFKKFVEDIEKTNAEVTIIGKVGRTLFVEAEPKLPYTYFDLPDYGMDAPKLGAAIRHLVQYEEIRVYFGKYQSVVTQVPTAFDITAGTKVSGDTGSVGVQYIFEPTVEQILMFFETQIFTSLFEQSVRESQLAKFASRILAMDSANQNIKKRIGELLTSKLRVVHALQNRRQINSLGPVVFSKF